MNILIIKLGATGDVVRTTPLLRRLSGSVTWITAAKNGVLLDGLSDNLRHFSWEARARALDIPYDLAINLEDTLEAAIFLKTSGQPRFSVLTPIRLGACVIPTTRSAGLI